MTRTCSPRPRTRRPVPGPGPARVGYIGRIAPQKDVGTLIRAFGRLTGQACLLIVGDGPDRRAAEQQARPLAGPVRQALTSGSN